MARSRNPKPEAPRPQNIAEKAQPFLERIERLDGEKATLQGEFRQKCGEVAAGIKEVIGEAKEAGITVKAIKGIVKRRRLQTKIDAIDDDFDMDESSQFAALAEAFGNTPFGEHARARANASRSPQQAAEREGEPAEQGRPDEQHLAKIGRGKGDVVDHLAH